MSSKFSTSETQDYLLTKYSCIAAMDEVGRGCIAGPVSVGVVVIDRICGMAPDGLADSKRLSAQAREQLVAPIGRWALASAVGYASASEIDAIGIIQALRLAGLRALRLANRQLVARQAGAIEFLLLDGKHNWLQAESTLFSDSLFSDPLLSDSLSGEMLGGKKFTGSGALGRRPLGGGYDSTGVFSSGSFFGGARNVSPGEANSLGSLTSGLEIATQMKADATCQFVSAASIVAKVARDAWMSRLPDPGYEWRNNKGYASAAHILGLQKLGVSNHHRRSWKLPGLTT